MRVCPNFANYLRVPTSMLAPKRAALLAGRTPLRLRAEVGSRSVKLHDLTSLNNLQNLSVCVIWETWHELYFKTRNSRTLQIHVVFLFPLEFRGLRLASSIAKVSFLVTFIHINLLFIRLSYIRILLNKKVYLYVNENIRWHLHNLKLTADRIYSSLQMTTLKFFQDGWQDGEQEKGNL